MSDNEALPVSQADRKAANTAYQAIAKGYLSVIGCALEAGADDNAVLVQLFARHAASARKEEQERAAGLCEALVQHNDRLRSAAAIANRGGETTNWLAFRGACVWTLAEYHNLVVECRGKIHAHASSGCTCSSVFGHDPECGVHGYEVSMGNAND